ncbi:MAG: bifunctional diaminohydroxyphosphoribosylaminopyrimidine deaminase/5-amino-6-(5-phosphoribosylamino)uracil reductase RibD [Phycisphaerales bacterium]
MSLDRQLLRRATLAALRAAGHAEPNPLVGCIIAARTSDHTADILGIGHHTKFGAPHAEVQAIHNARHRGNAHRLKGATAWVTLEPCNHHAKTPPCTDAILEAGIAEVIVARRDTHPDAQGGLERLAAAGLKITITNACPAATHLTDPFFASIERTPKRPWLIAKWAQTLDGKVATATGSSQWITGPVARRRVHALRARVDAIITGIGTIIRDNPMLTARQVPIRRTAARIILDRNCNTPPDAAIATTAATTPTIILCTPDAAASERADQLARLHCTITPCPPDPTNPINLDLPTALTILAHQHNIHTALLEAGPTLLSAAFQQDLVDEAWAFIAPTLLADHSAPAAVHWRSAQSITEATRLAPIATRRCAGDTLLILRRSMPA